jgi:hypothetical protein
MAKKHIIEFGLYHYAVDSITAATEAIRVLSKLQRVRLNTDADSSRDWYYEPDERDTRVELEMKLNQNFQEPRKPRPAKTLALPKPKRGTILCICERSSVAPGQTCAHCGRSFHESHNRTHGSDSSPKLRLI